MGFVWAPKMEVRHKQHKYVFKIKAKVWNGPGWDKVGLEFTGSKPDPKFLPSLKNNCLLCTKTKEQNTNQLTLPATRGNR